VNLSKTVMPSDGLRWTSKTAR